MTEDQILKVVEEGIKTFNQKSKDVFQSSKIVVEMHEKLDNNILGLCCSSHDRTRHTLKFSKQAFSCMSETETKHIVLHELAHALTNEYYPNAKQGHGSEFRMMCGLIGCKFNKATVVLSEETCDKMKENTVERMMSRGVFKCGCGTHYMSPTKSSKILYGCARFICRCCGGTIEKESYVGTKKVPVSKHYERGE